MGAYGIGVGASGIGAYGIGEGAYGIGVGASGMVAYVIGEGACGISGLLGPVANTPEHPTALTLHPSIFFCFVFF